MFESVRFSRGDGKPNDFELSASKLFRNLTCCLFVCELRRLE